jgi:hypothetical protein
MDPNWVLISNESFLSSFQINAQFWVVAYSLIRYWALWVTGWVIGVLSACVKHFLRRF